MIVAVLNQKGGVGKTTVTVNMAQAAAEAGRRVLVVDMDPQANSTDTLLADFEPGDAITINDVLDSGLEGSAADAIRPTDWHPNLMVVPSELALARREHDTSLALEFRLRKGLAGVAEQYDLVMVDCPPNIGRLTQNALVAAEWALLVSEAARASVQGLVGVMDTMKVIHEAYNPKLQVAGIVVNRVEATREAKGRQIELAAEFGHLVWTPAIPKRAAVTEAYGAAAPLSRFPDSRDAWDAIKALTEQLLALGEPRVIDLTPPVAVEA